jgi:hypothetical protein
MNQFRFFGKILLISSALILNLPSSSFSAPTCTPLVAVGGEKGQTVVQKMASVPRIPIGLGNLKRDNWNTDFSLPSNNKYKKFIATFTPQTTGTYSIRMYLKYSDGTADEIYNEKPNLTSGKPLEISATPRAEDHPYQVNIFVGDAESIGKSYKVKINACR